MLGCLEIIVRHWLDFQKGKCELPLLLWVRLSPDRDNSLFGRCYDPGQDLVCDTGDDFVGGVQPICEGFCPFHGILADAELVSDPLRCRSRVFSRFACRIRILISSKRCTAKRLLLSHISPSDEVLKKPAIVAAPQNEVVHRPERQTFLLRRLPLRNAGSTESSVTDTIAMI